MNSNKHQISIDIIAAAMMVMVIAVGNQCLTTGKSSSGDSAGIVSAHRETAPIVIAQYNPCPNGRCR
jgi:hypothetical protein